MERVGLRELDLRVSAPPIRRPYCHGTDFQRPGEPIAAEREEDEVSEPIGANRLGCFSGDYPVPAEEGMGERPAPCAAGATTARGDEPRRLDGCPVLLYDAPQRYQ